MLTFSIHLTSENHIIILFFLFKLNNPWQSPISTIATTNRDDTRKTG